MSAKLSRACATVGSMWLDSERRATGCETNDQDSDTQSASLGNAVQRPPPRAHLPGSMPTRLYRIGTLKTPGPQRSSVQPTGAISGSISSANLSFRTQRSIFVGLWERAGRSSAGESTRSWSRTTGPARPGFWLGPARPGPARPGFWERADRVDSGLDAHNRASRSRLGNTRTSMAPGRRTAMPRGCKKYARVSPGSEPHRPGRPGARSRTRDSRP